jgi:hypothetical protein
LGHCRNGRFAAVCCRNGSKHTTANLPSGYLT